MVNVGALVACQVASMTAIRNAQNFALQEEEERRKERKKQQQEEIEAEQKAMFYED